MSITFFLRKYHRHNLRPIVVVHAQAGSPKGLATESGELESDIHTVAAGKKRPEVAWTLRPLRFLVGAQRLELWTDGLRVRCSTN